MGILRLLSFRAAGKRLALALGEVRRVAPLPLLGAPAGAPAFVEGVFDFRGEPVAVLRLDRLLGEPDERLGLYSPLILLAGEPAMALHAARIDGVMKAEESALQPIDSGETFNGCVTGRLSEGGETLYLVKAENLLLAAERSRIAALDAMRRQRLDALDAGASHAA